jgi:hypothetical protein
VSKKVASMKPRGVAFAIESLANLDYRNEDTYKRLANVVISKIDDFIPHYLVKVLSAYFKLGVGSGELYDRLINEILKVLQSDAPQGEENGGGALKYSDMLRFFEMFPEVTYIYDSAMSEELYTVFANKIHSVMRDKKFPTEDVCRAFNILVRI